jgi:hypothetical protein
MLIMNTSRLCKQTKQWGNIKIGALRATYTILKNSSEVISSFFKTRSAHTGSGMYW